MYTRPAGYMRWVEWWPATVLSVHSASNVGTGLSEKPRVVLKEWSERLVLRANEWEIANMVSLPPCLWSQVSGGERFAWSVSFEKCRLCSYLPSIPRFSEHRTLFAATSVSTFPSTGDIWDPGLHGPQCAQERGVSGTRDVPENCVLIWKRVTKEHTLQFKRDGDWYENTGFQLTLEHRRG